MPTSPPTVEYELTSLGQELLPAIRSIVEVGSRLLLRDSPSLDDDKPAAPSRLARGKAQNILPE